MERLKGQTTINDHLYNEQGQEYVEALKDVIVINGHVVKKEEESKNEKASEV